jgi:hypothetical protein
MKEGKNALKGSTNVGQIPGLYTLESAHKMSEWILLHHL